MKLAIGQIKSVPGDIAGNTEKIIDYANRARILGANVIVFPELSIPGYLSMDLFHNKNFLHTNSHNVDRIAENTKGITTIVGYAEYSQNDRSNNLPIVYNSAAVLQDGIRVGNFRKILLPEYDIFDERRYFNSGDEPKVISVDGKKLGVEICEDMRDSGYDKKVTSELKKKGAEIIVNLSASPFYQGKLKDRCREISNHDTIFVYANAVGSFDGYDGQVVFDGRSMVYGLEGKLMSQGKAFNEDLLITDLDDIISTVSINSGIIDDLYDSLVFGIREFFEPFPEKKAVLGLSGGIDSAVVAKLAIDALGSNRVYGITMPSKYSSEHSISDAIELASNLGIELYNAPISDVHESLRKLFTLSSNRELIGVSDENIQARIRGALNMAFSNLNDDLVLSTRNKTEIALEYCTLHGDMAGALSPIGDVDKLNVYSLAEYVNRKNGKFVIPKNTIEKAPSAELSFGQEDEKGLGAGYDILSPLVNDIVDGELSYEDLIKKYPKELVSDTTKRINANEFKRRQGSPAIKVTKKAFGIGRRIPMVHKCT
jgi:NAD+ synthase (glutamine-hydrolysing)